MYKQSDENMSIPPEVKQTNKLFSMVIDKLLVGAQNIAIGRISHEL